MSDITSHSQLTINFPMACLLRHYEGGEIIELNRALAVLVKDLESSGGGQQPATYTQGGFHTDTEFINSENPAVVKFRKEILIPGIMEYMQHYYRLRFTKRVELKPEDLRIKGWANIMRQGEWNAPHEHPAHRNRISAVYYVQVPKCPRPQGALQFENPNPISAQYGEYGSINFHPVAGNLIMFPCYQRHFSHPFYTGDERVLIACDIQVDDGFDYDSQNDSWTLNIQGGPGS